MSEPVHRLLMRLHYLSGDRSAALSAFDACEQVLKHELGTSPDQQSLDLLAQVEAQSKRLVSTHRGVPPSVLRPPLVVGREFERAQMQTAWEQGHVLVLTGEGGLGKSRLLADFAASLAGAAKQVLLLGARPGDDRLPYALVSRCLRQLLARPGMSLGAGVTRELARVLPELGETSTRSDKTRFYNAVASTLERAAQTGLVGLLVDDLHQADSASLEWLQQACRCHGLRWIVATRVAELSAPAQGLLDGLWANAQIQRLDLQPLSVPHVAELLDTLALPDFAGADLAAALHQRCGGNPIYLLECIKMLWLDGVSQSIDVVGALAHVPRVNQIIGRMLLKLSTDGLRLARCAAVAATDFSAALAAAVLQVQPLDLSDAWAELEAAQVMRDSAFAHDLIFEAALASVPQPIARELHRQIALWLQQHAGAPDRVASHWLDAHEHLLAVPHLLAAAAQTKARKCYDESSQHALLAGEILQQAEQPEAAFDAFVNAIDSLTRLGNLSLWSTYVQRLERLARNDTQRAFVGLAQAYLLSETMQLDGAEQVTRRTLVLAQSAGATETQAELEWLMAIIHWERRELGSAWQCAERALALRRSLPSEQCRLDPVSGMTSVLSGTADLLSALGRFDEAQPSATETYDYVLQQGRNDLLPRSIKTIIDLELARGQLAAAAHWVQRMTQVVQDGTPHQLDQTHAAESAAVVAMAQGAWEQALVQMDEVVDALAKNPDRFGVFMLVRVAHNQRLLGRRDLAMRTLKQAAALVGSSAPSQLAVHIGLAAAGEAVDQDHFLECVIAVDDLVLRANLLLNLSHLGPPSAALLHVLSLSADAMDRGGADGYWLALEGRLAACLAEVGRHTEAAQAARRAWARSTSGISPCRVVFAELAADLACALRATDPSLADNIRQKGLDWLLAATPRLEPMWRESCLQRGPLQRLLGPGEVQGALAHVRF